MRAFPFLLVWVVVLLAACGGDEGPSPSRSPTPAATATATPLPPIDGTVTGEGPPPSTDPYHIKSNPDPLLPPNFPVLKDVRVGAHPEQGGWDRIVFEFEGGRPAGDIEYVNGISGCGSGLPLALRGSAVLKVKFTPANAHDEQGQVSIKGQQGKVPPSVTGPGNVILESKQNCDFEAEVTWALGVSTKRPFRVFLLDNPTRVVIDVKW